MCEQIIICVYSKFSSHKVILLSILNIIKDRYYTFSTSIYVKFQTVVENQVTLKLQDFLAKSSCSVSVQFDSFYVLLDFFYVGVG